MASCWLLYINDKLKGVFPDKESAYDHFCFKYPGFHQFKETYQQKPTWKDEEVDFSVSWGDDLGLKIQRTSFLEKTEEMKRGELAEILRDFLRSQ